MLHSDYIMGNCSLNSLLVTEILRIKIYFCTILFEIILFINLTYRSNRVGPNEFCKIFPLTFNLTSIDFRIVLMDSSLEENS